MLGIALLIWPDYLTYFNTTSGRPLRGHEYLLDSNLDWGQDLIALRDFQREHGGATIDLAYFGRVPPDVYGVSYRDLFDATRNRFVVVSANLLWGRMYFINCTDVWPQNRNVYSPLRSFTPIAVLGNTLYVFDTE